MNISVELIPRTSFGTNLRSKFRVGDWDTLRRYCYREANYCCQLCGGVGPNHPVEAHELWEYNDGIQKIVDLLALCPTCHIAHHPGFARTQGRCAEARAQLMKVNQWSAEDAQDHIDKAFLVWEDRSQIEWKLDLTLAQQMLDHLNDSITH